MNGNFRVLNITRGFSIKYKHALKGIKECACTWVEYGVSVRDLTLAESIAARNEQARLAEPLPFAELPGLVFELRKGERTSNSLVWKAALFVGEKAA